MFFQNYGRLGTIFIISVKCNIYGGWFDTETFFSGSLYWDIYHSRDASRKKGGVIRNTGLVFGKDGDIKGEYSKRHLFYGYLEAELMRPGRKLLYEDIDGVRTGMAVCYEFYFPRMWRKMAKRASCW